MIRVVKPIAPPAVLINRGATATQTHCNEYDASHADIGMRNKSIRLRQEHLRRSGGKGTALLKTAQHGKCAFCRIVGAAHQLRSRRTLPTESWLQSMRRGDSLKRPRLLLARLPTGGQPCSSAVSSATSSSNRVISLLRGSAATAPGFAHGPSSAAEESLPPSSGNARSDDEHHVSSGTSGRRRSKCRG